MKTAVTLRAVSALIGAGVFVIFWTRSEAITYDPPFDPKNFENSAANKYFALKPGTAFRFSKKKVSGSTVRVEVEVTRETKQIMGVTTTAVRDREWVNDELVEDTTDWYAPDKDGNVWYFGEVVNNYKDGKLTDQVGSWEAG